jgi:hypothetical protein
MRKGYVGGFGIIIISLKPSSVSNGGKKMVMTTLFPILSRFLDLTGHF